MERLKHPMSQEWHVAVNQHQDAQRDAGKPWEEARFMYEAMHLADEVPRMAMLFKAERKRLCLRGISNAACKPPFR